MQFDPKELLDAHDKAQRDLHWVPCGYAALALLAFALAVAVVVVNWR